MKMKPCTACEKNNIRYPSSLPSKRGESTSTPKVKGYRATYSPAFNLRAWGCRILGAEGYRHSLAQLLRLLVLPASDPRHFNS